MPRTSKYKHSALCLYFTHPPTFPSIVITTNLWIFIVTPTTQGSAITMICPDKATSSSPLQQLLHILKLSPACSATFRHFHLPPHYEDNMMTVHVSFERANLNSLMTLPNVFTFGNILVVIGLQLMFRNWQMCQRSLSHSFTDTDWPE